MWIEGCLFICMICLFLFLVIHLNSFLFIGKSHKAFVVWVLQIGQTSTPLQFVWILRAAIKFRKVQVMRGKTTHSLTPSEPNQGFSASNHRSYSRALCFLIWRKFNIIMIKNYNNNRKCAEIKLTFSRVFLFLRGAITLARATFQTIPNRSNLSKSARVGHLSTQITVFQLSSNGRFFFTNLDHQCVFADHCVYESIMTYGHDLGKIMGRKQRIRNSHFGKRILP